MDVMQDSVTGRLSVTRTQLKAHWSDNLSAPAAIGERANTDGDFDVTTLVLRNLLQLCIDDVLSAGGSLPTEE